MKAIILISLIAMAMAAEIADYYPSHKDDLDPESVLADTVRFQEYLDCFKGTKPCSEEANSHKVNIPEVLAQTCKRCSPARKHLIRRFHEVLKERHPEEYELFRKILDPENKYYDALLAAIADS